jgi:ribosomal protein S18 acetylase RimI-like enzyme
MSSVEISLRAACEADIGVLREFEQQVVLAERPFNSTIREDEVVFYYDIEHLIASDDSLLVVGERAGELVATGYVQLRVSKAHYDHERHAYLGFMYVVPECRGKGLNRVVLDHLVQWSQEQGVDVFSLDVYADNAAAVRAYEKYGFKPLLLEMTLDQRPGR